MGSDRICIREASKRLTSSDISPYCKHEMKNTKVEGFDASTKKDMHELLGIVEKS